MAPDATRPLCRLLSSRLLPRLGLRRARAPWSLSRAHPFLELPRSPRSPLPAASRRAHARLPQGLLPPLRPLGTSAGTPGRSARAPSLGVSPPPLLGRPIRSCEGHGARGTSRLRPRSSSGDSLKPSFRYYNGLSEFRTFALGKVCRSPFPPALSFSWGLNLLSLPASSRGGGEPVLLASLPLDALCTILLCSLTGMPRDTLLMYDCVYGKSFPALALSVLRGRTPRWFVVVTQLFLQCRGLAEHAKLA